MFDIANNVCSVCTDARPHAESRVSHDVEALVAFSSDELLENVTDVTSWSQKHGVLCVLSDSGVICDSWILLAVKWQSRGLSAITNMMCVSTERQF